MVDVSISELEKLSKNGITQIEISKILNISISTVKRLYKKFNIKSNFNSLKNLEINCLNCGKNINCVLSEYRKFCSRNCSGSFNTKGRIHSEETKNKIRNKLKKNKIKIKKERLCKNCKNIVGFRKTICEDCKKMYYKYYRPNAEFQFNINLYKDKFEFDLIEKHGWYSPSNKGNNLNGVSKDHLYSVKDGFINNIDTEIIKHPANCKLMIHNENNKKNSNSSITLEELLERIKSWK